jgi:acyl-coenzyme A synthetase/AMP-(fatty) acid ligase
MDIYEVNEAIVFGKPNSVLGNILCANIVVKRDITTLEIRNHLLKKLQNFKIPRVIKCVSEIEKTRTGKKKII